MRKHVLILAFAVMGLLAFTACGGNDNQSTNPNENSQSEVTNSIVDNDQEQETALEENRFALEDSEESVIVTTLGFEYIYTNDFLGVSVALPTGFDDFFSIEENLEDIDERGGAGITIYHPSSRDAGYTGNIFYIERWIGDWDLDAPPIWAGTHYLALKTETHTFILRTTSGVEYNENDNEAVRASAWIREQLDTISDNVSILLPQTPHNTEMRGLELRWQRVIGDDGLTDENEYTFADGTVGRYITGDSIPPAEYLILTEDGFSPARVRFTEGYLTYDGWIPLSVLPEPYNMVDDERTFRDFDGETYVLWVADAIPEIGTLFHAGDNPILFTGREFPGGGEELLDDLIDKMNYAFDNLVYALENDIENIHRGFLAEDYTSPDALQDMLNLLRQSIDATSYVTKLGNFVVFNGPYTTLWDVRTNEVYFFTTVHMAGFIRRADFNDRELFIPMFFAD